VTKNGRPKGFEEKSVRLCSLCRLPGHKKTTCNQNPKYVPCCFTLALLFHLLYIESHSLKFILCSNMA
jgi:hypothetical protein